MVDVFREVWRVLRDDGTCWLNIGDSYAGSWGNQGRKEERGSQRPINGPMMQSFNGYPAKESNTGTVPPGLKPKDLVGIPWRLAFALQADGWYLRSDIIWAKPSPMPESVTDRPTKSHEYIFLLTKNERYFFDQEAVKEPASYAGKSRGGSTNRYEQNAAGMDNKLYNTRNLRTVWKEPEEFLTDVGDGGMSRTTSPDCPVHGYLAFPPRVQSNDEPQVVSHPDHNQHTCDGPLPGQAAFAFAIPENPPVSPLHAGSAKLRSNQIRKTGASLERDETCDDKQDSRIECKELTDHSAAMCNRISGNSISPDALPDVFGSGLSERIPDHSEGISACAVSPLKCTCNYIDQRTKDKTYSHYFPSVWTITSEAFSGSHFAVFPTKLAARCIKAGTSERGCCPKCGKCWDRETECNGEWRAKHDRQAKHNGAIYRTNPGGGIAGVNVHRPIRDLGFRPACSCPAADPVPCIVLDPFSGAATTGVAALGLKRRYVGLELSPEYLEIARRRITRPHAPAVKATRVEHHPLFPEDMQ